MQDAEAVLRFDALHCLVTGCLGENEQKRLSAMIHANGEESDQPAAKSSQMLKYDFRPNRKIILDTQTIK